jgi:Domain of unknown function (DUF4760)
VNLNIVDRFVRIFVGFCAASALVLLTLALFFKLTSWPPTVPEHELVSQYSAYADLANVIIAAAATATSVISFLFARHVWRSDIRRNTFSILLETRLSSEFRETTQKRRAVFPEYTEITFADWDQARRADARHGTEAQRAEARHLNEGAWALITLLNYYEFLALGIESGDLDEPMLHRSVRGIMCSLVDDARYVIAELRRNDPKTYANLAVLYGRWRVDGARDIDGKPNERPIPSA